LFLTEVICIEIADYAIMMSYLYYVVLPVDQDRANALSDGVVIMR